MEGKARVKFEDMVHRAERKILQSERHSAKGISVATKAEALAKELFHTAGSVLTEKEIARLFEASGCEEQLRLSPFRRYACPRLSKVYRTFSGVCNNLYSPGFGAARTAFRRLIAPQYEDGVSKLRGTMQSEETGIFMGPFSPPNPSARIVSLNVVRNRSGDEDNLSHLHMQWGQFLLFDIDRAAQFTDVKCNGCAVDGVCVPIRVPPDDPSFGNSSGVVCHPFKRSIPVCDSSYTNPTRLTYREQLNELTSFIDGSQVYGSSKRVFEAVWETNTSKLRTGPNFPGTCNVHKNKHLCYQREAVYSVSLCRDGSGKKLIHVTSLIRSCYKHKVCNCLGFGNVHPSSTITCF